MRFTADAITGALALLLILAGALWLPIVGAGTADMNVALTIIAEDSGDSGGSGSGSGSGATTPAIPVQPIPSPKVVAVSPKALANYTRNVITIYGYNLPLDLAVVIKSPNHVFQTNSVIGRVASTALIVGAVETISYEIPAKVLEPGLVTISVRYGSAVLWEEQVIIYDRAEPLHLRGRAMPSTLSATIVSGQTANIALHLRNTGRTDWNPSVEPLHIGTSGPRDRQSKFIHPTWLYSNRAARVNLADIVLSPQQEVDMLIPLQAPTVKRKTVFIERFALVAEGLAWVPGSEFRIRITVLPAPSPARDTEAKPTSPIPTTTDTTGRSNDVVTPIGRSLNLSPTSSSAAEKTPSPYKMPNEIKSTARWSSVTTVLNNWFVKPLTSLFTVFGKLWK